MESAEEMNEFAVSTMGMLEEPEDVLEDHHKRTGAANKAPNPLAVAQFREGLEKVNKISTNTDKLPVSTKHLFNASIEC